jgi:hypothetical protein
MGIKEWIAGIAIKKGIGSAVKLGVSMATSVVVAGYLEQIGIHVDKVQLEAGLTIAINSGLKILMNFLKVKYGFNLLG